MQGEHIYAIDIFHAEVAREIAWLNFVIEGDVRHLGRAALEEDVSSASGGSARRGPLACESTCDEAELSVVMLSGATASVVHDSVVTLGGYGVDDGDGGGRVVGVVVWGGDVIWTVAEANVVEMEAAVDASDDGVALRDEAVSLEVTDCAEAGLWIEVERG